MPMSDRDVRAVVTPEPDPDGSHRFRAVLFGGEASGCTVELADFPPLIAVELTDRNVVVVSVPTVVSGPMANLYELVSPVGPETPTYVSCRS
jgi:hypothetical protein